MCGKKVTRAFGREEGKESAGAGQLLREGKSKRRHLLITGEVEEI